MTNPYETHGAFSWSELATTDPEAAKAFYGELLGWTFQDNPMPGMTYSMIKNGEEAVGGLMPMPQNAPEGMPPSWGCYVTVADVDAVVAKVPELGGTVLLPPHDIPTVGRMTIIRDPQGAFISLITYKMGE